MHMYIYIYRYIIHIGSIVTRKFHILLVNPTLAMNPLQPRKEGDRRPGDPSLVLGSVQRRSDLWNQKTAATDATVREV